MVTEGPIGERIRIYRRRRGLSQTELADLAGRSESWLSQVERGIRSVDRLSVLIDIARVLNTDVETLAGNQFSLAPNGQPDSGDLNEIRAALSSYPGLGLASVSAGSLDEIERLTTEAHRRYQAADYGAAAHILPSLITSSDATVAEARGDDLRRALVTQNYVYVATAKLVTKIGDGQLAWLASDRAATAAMRAEEPTHGAAAAYQVACAFLKLDQLDRAEHIAVNTAENMLDDSPLGISLQGALFLISSVIAGRRNDRREADERLRRAQYLADALNEDGNYGWTAFGPTNVAIHKVSAAAELGDAKTAIERAEDITTDGLPDGLKSRRAQVHIDTAWAYSQHREDAAVVVNLLEAERVAPQTLRYNVIVRELLRELLKREKALSDTRTAQTRHPCRSAALTNTLYLLACAAPPARELDEPLGLLQDAGWSPCVVLTPTTASWIDSEAFDVPVRVYPRTPSEPDPLPAADAVLVAPATFHTLNKVGAGLNDTLVASLINELLGYELPTVIAPCVKAQLRSHPAYPASLRVLNQLGAQLIDPDRITRRGPDGLATFDWPTVVTEFFQTTTNV